MIEIVKYSNTYEEKWDKFVLEQSMNGTFLHTQRFLNYHPKERFEDHSILFFKGNDIIAVIPAHIVKNEEQKLFVSHQGSTFGGIVLGEQFKKISVCDDIFSVLDLYIKEHKFSKIFLKMPGLIYCNSMSEILDYFACLYGYRSSYELGYYIDFSKYKEDILQNLKGSKRRDYRYALKNNLEFVRLYTEEEIAIFYGVLCDNFTKFQKKPVHTLEEIFDLKQRLGDILQFYGVKFDGRIIAGSMVFAFKKEVFHTQYLACLQDKTSLFTNEFLYVKLIETARSDGFSKISFGTTTLEGGKILNKNLAQFKEGFGTLEYTNKTYIKTME